MHFELLVILLAFSCSSATELEDINNEIAQLTDRVASLELEVRDTISALRPPYAELGNGWITPYNGFRYALTDAAASWQIARQLCQAMGADLAVNGIKDPEVRRTIEGALSRGYTWVGLTDIEVEGTFVWVDGTPLTDEEAANLWEIDEPNSVGNEDCVSLQGGSAEGFDYRCIGPIYGFCEKDWSSP